MKSLQYFIIEPLNGKRYENTIDDIGLIFSASIEDHKATQRFAVVKEIPKFYSGEIMPGDIVVVHHNIFRLYYDIKGRLKSSWNYIDEDTYICEQNQIYMYKRNGEWKVPYPYCFVEPIDKLDSFLAVDEKFANLLGKVTFYPSDDLAVGDLVAFRPDTEYEFKIDGNLMYRMQIKDLCLKI